MLTAVWLTPFGALLLTEHAATGRSEQEDAGRRESSRKRRLEMTAAHGSKF
jgi:hypothetical protein